MAQARRSSRKEKDAPVGQVDVFGIIHGLDKLVDKPTVIEDNGLKVIHLLIKEEEKETPGYIEEALKLARQMLPEAVSKSKPPWMNAEWQAKRRKRNATG